MQTNPEAYSIQDPPRSVEDPKILVFFTYHTALLSLVDVSFECGSIDGDDIDYGGEDYWPESCKGSNKEE